MNSTVVQQADRDAGQSAAATDAPRAAGKVVVLGPMPPPIHGAARVTHEMVERLRGAGADVVVCNSQGRWHRPPVAYHASRAAAHIGAARALLRGRKTEQRTLYVTGAGGMGLWYQAAVITCARAMGYRTVFHHHSFAYLQRRVPAMRAVVRAGGRSGYHVALCERMAASLHALYNARNVHVCSNAGLFNGPSAVRVTPRDTAAQRPLTLGHLSNLSVDKGLALVIASLRALRARGVDAHLHLAGPAATSAAAALIRTAAAEFGTALTYEGAIAPAQVPAFLRGIDLFLFPSAYAHEAEPLVVLEAIDSGARVVSFDIGCLGSMVPGNGWLVQPGDDYVAHVVQIAAGIIDGTETTSSNADGRQADARAAVARRQASNLLSLIASPGSANAPRS